MKTRQELQKENDYMKTLLRAKDEEIAEQAKLILEKVEDGENNRRWQCEASGWRYKYNQLKSKSFFQLIRWWFNAKN